MRSRRRKYYIYVISILILVSAYWIFHKKRAQTEITVPKLNYPFRNDGKLYFIDSGKSDTLARINIEIANTQTTIMRGLMDRDSLKMDHGMLFIFDDEEQRTFWMKNTRFPLDILFIGENKKILYIAEYTTPYSTNPIPGFYPARYVLEVNAGYCHLHGIIPGVLIDYSSLSNFAKTK